MNGFTGTPHINPPSTWNRGDVLLALKLDEAGVAIRQLLDDRGPQWLIDALANVRPEPAEPFELQQVFGEYLLCARAGVTGSAVPIAKPPLLRDTNLAHDGNTFTYTSPTVREANDGTNTETQRIKGAYAVGDEIWAIPVTTGVLDAGMNPIGWLDLNVDGRHWTAD